MKFADLPLEEAEGALLAHSLRAGTKAFKKGRKLSAADIAALRVEGIETVFAAHLGAGEVPEDEAAAKLAEALGADSGLRPGAPFTGRANLFAETAGLTLIDRSAIDKINAVHEAITLATLAPYESVSEGQMVATVKIIPFACPKEALEEACAIAREQTALGLAPFQPQRYGLLSTQLPSLKESLLDKTRQVLEARITALEGTLVEEARLAHEVGPLAAALQEMAGKADILLVSGASAIVDRQDVVPAAIEAAGGAVLHFGMPVDPGNLLLLGELSGKPVLGLPGCARSPKLNGADWVMQRLAANLPVAREDITAMGVGGLLKEISSRPQPREGGKVGSARPRVVALILAAGRSSRMGLQNKLLAPIEGVPMVARTANAALASGVDTIIAVTGHEKEAVEAALAAHLPAGNKLRLTHNPDYREGLSASLKAGIAAAEKEGADALLILLGDMPDVSASVIDRLIAAYDPEEGRLICIPTFQGKRGNPVLWDARFFEEMQSLRGDIGAKPLIAQYEEAVCEVPVPEDTIHRDLDTPEALAARTKT